MRHYTYDVTRMCNVQSIGVHKRSEQCRGFKEGLMRVGQGE